MQEVYQCGICPTAAVQDSCWDGILFNLTLVVLNCVRSLRANMRMSRRRVSVGSRLARSGLLFKSLRCPKNWQATLQRYSNSANALSIATEHMSDHVRIMNGNWFNHMPTLMTFAPAQVVQYHNWIHAVLCPDGLNRKYWHKHISQGQESYIGNWSHLCSHWKKRMKTIQYKVLTFASILFSGLLWIQSATFFQITEVDTAFTLRLIFHSISVGASGRGWVGSMMSHDLPTQAERYFAAHERFVRGAWSSHFWSNNSHEKVFCFFSCFKIPYILDHCWLSEADCV